MRFNLGVLRDQLLSALLPAGAFFIATACSVADGEDDGDSAGAGTSGSAGATGGTGGTAGTDGTGGIPGTAGMGGGGGWFGVPPGGRDCNTVGGVGTCCLYDHCLTPEEFAALDVPYRYPAEAFDAGAAGMSGAGGDGGRPAPGAACSPVTQISTCSFVVSAAEAGDGKCCYVIRQGTCCGRPFVVAGAARTSLLMQRDDWAHEARSMLSALTAFEREELTSAWAADALMEHASIASFARFSLELLALGAPGDFVEASQRASLDEVEHARLCFALCSRFTGSSLGPTPLYMDGFTLGRNLASVAAAAVREGCVGETLAAALAQAQLAVAEDPDCRRALEIIARDEAEHSLLAWRFVQWALQSGQEEVREAVSRAFREAHGRDVHAVARTTSPRVWNHFGRLTNDQERDVVREAWAVIIEPALAALLGSPGGDLGDAAPSERAFLASAEDDAWAPREPVI